MKYLYFPGCTLKTKAQALEEPVLDVLRGVDIELKELDQWYCCGASFSLVDDNLIRLVGPMRTLISAEKEGGGKLVTTCSFCYNTLKRVNRVILNDSEKRRKVTDFIEEEYQGNVEVVHLLELIRDAIGFGDLSARTGINLNGKKVAPYYGCLLLRPADELRFDDPNSPSIMEDYLRGLGAEVVEYPYKSDCCGSYLMVRAPEVVRESCKKILEAAIAGGAQALVMSCPLCHYNLSENKKALESQHSALRDLEVLYFTELLGDGFSKRGSTQ